MKKRIISMMLVVAAMTSMLSISAFASQNVDLKVTVDDTLVEFPDAKPFADENNRTLIPVRFVTEAMGADVSWDQASQTAIIEKDGTKVEITIGQKNIKVTENGSTKTVTMDTVAVAKDNRTFVPIRFVAEALGAYVDYSDLYKAVEIVMPEEVTAAEIKRLRSYDMVQSVDLNSLRDKANWWMDEYDSFTGSYWFSNSHYFLVTLDRKLVYDVKNIYAETKAPKGTNALDYANFAVQYAEDELEEMLTIEVAGKTYRAGNWTSGSLILDFRTDDSLIYQCECPSQSVLSVRGIIDIYAKSERGAKLLSEQFGIANPVIGETYSVDAELVCGVGPYYYLDLIQLYRFEDGNAVPVSNKLNSEK